MSDLEKTTVSEGYESTQLGPIKREIPLHWDVHKLGDIANVNMGSSPKSEYYNEKGDGLPFFQGNADFGPQHPEVTVWCTNPNKTADERDLLLSVRAPVGDLNIADQHCCIGRGLAAISEEEAHNHFLYYLLTFERSRLETYAQGSTFKSVNSGVLNNFPVQFPPFPEQQHIADILSTVDEQIQQTDEMIEETKELNRGLMQDLLTTGVESRETESAEIGPMSIEIAAEWPMEYFDDVIDVNPRDEITSDDMFPFLPMDGINQELREIAYWEERIADDCTSIRFRSGDTVYAKITPCAENGKIAFINGIDGLGFGSTELFVFRAKENKMIPKYVYYLVNNPQFRAVTISLMEGSTGRQRIPTDVFENNLRVPVPSVDEQNQIVNILDRVSDKLREEREYKNNLQELKRGLMQDLLTGRVRVDPAQTT